MKQINKQFYYLISAVFLLYSCNNKKSLPPEIESQRFELNKQLNELIYKADNKTFSSYESMVYDCRNYKDNVIKYNNLLNSNGYSSNINPEAIKFSEDILSYFENELRNFNENKRLGELRYQQEMKEREESIQRVNDFIDEYNKVPSYNGASTKGRDYYVGGDGRVYENKACGFCGGSGYVQGYDMVTERQIMDVCNACEGVGQLSYYILYLYLKKYAFL